MYHYDVSLAVLMDLELLYDKRHISKLVRQHTR